MEPNWDTSWPLKPRKQLTHDDYTIAWLCALPVEKSAARNMLDEVHQRPPQPEADKNIYEFGSICGHNVVIVCQGDMGSTATTVVATRMHHTFRKLRIGLLVGIGAGVPDHQDVRLGDVVISKGNGISGGVVAHDRGKITSNGFVSKPFLNGVPEVLRNAFVELASLLLDQDNKIETFISASRQRNPRFREFIRPALLADNLYHPDYLHVDPEDRICAKCQGEEFIKHREERAKDESLVFFGTIASGNQVIKDGRKRAEIAATNHDILAIEMEAAGLMDVFGCATIRGICDYADSHKNDGWHKYAAAAAAAMARETLAIIPVSGVARSKVVPVAVNKHCLLPREINSNFTGRRNILDILREQLCTRDDNGISAKRRKFVLRGIGGCGKSEVCLKFAEENRQRFWGIFWIDCSSVKNIKESFARLSRRCKVGEELEEAKDFLQNIEQPWLLILDNADDTELDLSDYMPGGDYGNILISTRNPDCEYFSSAGREIFEKFDFEKLEVEDAVTLLLKSSRVSKGLWDERRHDAEEVVRLLVQHALAIVNAGAYIREKLCTLKDYPSEFKRQREIMLEHYPKQAKSTYGGVYATFAASTELIAERAKTDPAYHAALELFDVLGYMHFNGITPEIWKRASGESQDEGNFDQDGDNINYFSIWHKSFVPKFVQDMNEKLLLRKGINILVSFSLINEQNDSNVLSMHPLAHSWARDRLGHKERIQAWTRAAVILCLSKKDVVYGIFWRQLRLHVSSCMQESPTDVWSTCPPLEIARLFYCLSNLLLWERDTTAAYDGFKSIQEHFQPLKGSTNWLRTQGFICHCLGDLGQNQRELSLREEMNVYLKDTIPRELRWMLERGLAQSYYRNHQLEKAKQLQKKVVRRQRKVLNPTDPDLLTSLHNVALTYTDLGRHHKAAKLLEEVVEIRATILDRTDPYLLASRHALGCAYLESKMPTKAIEILKDVVEIRMEVLRSTHPELLRSQHELAKAYAKSGAHDKAIELMEKVVEIWRETLDPANSDRLLSQYELGRFYVETNSFSKAIEILKEVVRIRKEVFESSDDKLLWSRYLLASAYIGNGMYTEAIETLEEVVRTRKQTTSGTFSGDLLFSQSLLGKAYLKNAMYTESIAILEEVFEVEAREYSLTNTVCLTTRWDLAIAYWKVSRREDTLRLLEEVVPLLADSEEPPSPQCQDFERLLERCRENPDEPLSSEFEEHQVWKSSKKPVEPTEVSDTSSISSIEDAGSEDADSGDEPNENPDNAFEEFWNNINEEEISKTERSGNQTKNGSDQVSVAPLVFETEDSPQISILEERRELGMKDDPVTEEEDGYLTASKQELVGDSRNPEDSISQVLVRFGLGANLQVRGSRAASPSGLGFRFGLGQN